MFFAFRDETPEEKRKRKKQKVEVEVDEGTHQDRIKEKPDQKVLKQRHPQGRLVFVVRTMSPSVLVRKDSGFFCPRRAQP